MTVLNKLIMTLIRKAIARILKRMRLKKPLKNQGLDLKYKYDHYIREIFPLFDAMSIERASLPTVGLSMMIYFVG